MFAKSTCVGTDEECRVRSVIAVPGTKGCRGIRLRLFGVSGEGSSNVDNAGRGMVGERKCTSNEPISSKSGVFAER